MNEKWVKQKLCNRQIYIQHQTLNIYLTYIFESCLFIFIIKTHFLSWKNQQETIKSN